MPLELLLLSLRVLLLRMVRLSRPRLQQELGVVLGVVLLEAMGVKTEGEALLEVLLEALHIGGCLPQGPLPSGPLPSLQLLGTEHLEEAQLLDLRVSGCGGEGRVKSRPNSPSMPGCNSRLLTSLPLHLVCATPEAGGM